MSSRSLRQRPRVRTYIDQALKARLNGALDDKVESRFQRLPIFPFVRGTLPRAQIAPRLRR